MRSSAVWGAHAGHKPGSVGCELKWGGEGGSLPNMCFSACVRACLAFRTRSTLSHGLNLAFHPQRASSHMAICQSVRLADQLAEKFLTTGCITAGTHGDIQDNAAQRSASSFTFFGLQERMDQASGLARFLPFGPETIKLKTSRLVRVPARGAQ